LNWLRPLIREAQIVYYRWAQHEICPMHPDLPVVVHRLRDLLAEREADPRNPLRAVWQWL